MTDEQLDRLIAAVENEVSTSEAWDLQDPRDIARAFVRAIRAMTDDDGDENEDDDK